MRDLMREDFEAGGVSPVSPDVVSSLEMGELTGIQPVVYDHTVDGKCIGCGNCCGSMLPMTKEEFAVLSAYVSSHHVKLYEHAIDMDSPIKVDLSCPFWDDSKPSGRQCAVYEARPKICRAWDCGKITQDEPLTEDDSYWDDAEIVDLWRAFGDLRRESR